MSQISFCGYIFVKVLEYSKRTSKSAKVEVLPFVQEGMHQLERQMKRICSLCEERQALAKKDTQLYNGEKKPCPLDSCTH